MFCNDSNIETELLYKILIQIAFATKHTIYFHVSKLHNVTSIPFGPIRNIQIHIKFDKIQPNTGFIKQSNVSF